MFSKWQTNHIGKRRGQYQENDDGVDDDSVDNCRLNNGTSNIGGIKMAKKVKIDIITNESKTLILISY